LFQIFKGMIESVKKLKELEIKLNSKNKKEVSDAIISLRNEDPFKGAINLLVLLFDSSDDPSVRDQIRNFLNDLKEPAVRFEVVTEVRKHYKPDTLSMVVSSCWQSGLDYSGYANDFAEAFIRGDYMTALECFTVIEESATSLSEDIKTGIIRLLGGSIEISPVEKNALRLALLDLLR
jgi:hypothetical protein